MLTYLLMYVTQWKWDLNYYYFHIVYLPYCHLTERLLSLTSRISSARFVFKVCVWRIPIIIKTSENLTVFHCASFCFRGRRSSFENGLLHRPSGTTMEIRLQQDYERREQVSRYQRCTSSQRGGAMRLRLQGGGESALGTLLRRLTESVEKYDSAQ